MPTLQVTFLTLLGYFLLLLSGGIRAVLAAEVCEESHDAPFWLAVNKKAFYIEPNVRLNWYGALHFCAANGKNLASIESAEEQNALINYINTNNISKLYWIAGNNLEKNNLQNFYWANTGQKMQFSKWAYDQPDNYLNRENCVHIFYYSGGEWNDEMCSNEMAVICQLRL